MQRLYYQGWKDLQVQLQRKLNQTQRDKVTVCPDCRSRLYFTDSGCLCPMCGYTVSRVH